MDIYEEYGITPPPKSNIGEVLRAEDEARLALLAQQKLVRDDEPLLDRLVRKSMENIEEILDTEANPYDPNYMKMIAAKKDAAVSIINAGLKADENRFRKENRDVIVRLFEKIERQKLADPAPLPVLEGQITEGD